MHIGKAICGFRWFPVPIALYPATSEREKVSFNQINRETGHRIRYRKVDAETGEEVPSDQIIKGYEVAKGEYVEITDEELESVALESTKTIDIDEFVPRNEIDELYNIRPYYIAPDGKVGEDAFVVIRNIIEQMKMVAIGRVVLTSREHVIAITPRGKGLMGTLLRFPYEVRDAGEYFDDIPNVKLTKDMMDLARHIVETKSGHFKPEKFEDHYEHALKELIEKKAKGEKIEVPKEQPTGKVINLMDALRRSVQAENRRPRTARRRQKRPQERRRTKGNAAADCRKKSRQGRGRESNPKSRQAPQSRLGTRVEFFSRSLSGQRFNPPQYCRIPALRSADGRVAGEDFWPRRSAAGFAVLCGCFCATAQERPPPRSCAVERPSPAARPASPSMAAPSCSMTAAKSAWPRSKCRRFRRRRNARARRRGGKGRAGGAAWRRRGRPQTGGTAENRSLWPARRLRLCGARRRGTLGAGGFARGRFCPRRGPRWQPRLREGTPEPGKCCAERQAWPLGQFVL